MLLQSLASIPQIYQSIFQINRPERKTVYSKPCGSRRNVPGWVPDVRIEVRRDLNTDVSVFDWHAWLWLASRWRLAVAKGQRENCRDVGRAPARKVHTVICHRSGHHYLKSGGPTYLGGPYGPVKDKMYWPKLARRSEKCAGPAGRCLCRGLAGFKQLACCTSFLISRMSVMFGPAISQTFWKCYDRNPHKAKETDQADKFGQTDHRTGPPVFIFREQKVTEMKMWALRDHVRNDNTRERLKVENITERCRKARLRWFGRVKRRDQEYIGRKTMETVPPGRTLKKRKTEAEMDGLWQPRHESYRDNRRWSLWQNWLEENCLCRSDPTIKWRRKFFTPSPTPISLHPWSAISSHFPTHKDPPFHPPLSPVQSFPSGSLQWSRNTPPLPTHLGSAPDSQGARSWRGSSSFQPSQSRGPHCKSCYLTPWNEGNLLDYRNSLLNNITKQDLSRHCNSDHLPHSSFIFPELNRTWASVLSLLLHPTFGMIDWVILWKRGPKPWHEAMRTPETIACFTQPQLSGMFIKLVQCD